MGYFVRHAIWSATRTTISNIKAAQTERCADILTVYRRYCSNSASPGQLILPDAFKVTPYCLHSHIFIIISANLQSIVVPFQGVAHLFVSLAKICAAEKRIWYCHWRKELFAFTFKFFAAQSFASVFISDDVFVEGLDSNGKCWNFRGILWFLIFPKMSKMSLASTRAGEAAPLPAIATPFERNSFSRFCVLDGKCIQLLDLAWQKSRSNLYQRFIQHNDPTNCTSNSRCKKIVVVVTYILFEIVDVCSFFSFLVDISNLELCTFLFFSFPFIL